MPRTRRQRQGTRRPAVPSTPSEPDQGEQFLRLLIGEQELADAEDDERASDVEADFEDGGSVFSLAEHTDSSESVISDSSDDRPGHEELSIAPDAVDEVCASAEALPVEIDIPEARGGDGDADPPAAPPALPTVGSPSEGDGDGMEGGRCPKYGVDRLGTIFSRKTSLCLSPWIWKQVVKMLELFRSPQRLFDQN